VIAAAAASAGRSGNLYETHTSPAVLEERDALLVGEMGEVMHLAAAQTAHVAVHDVGEPPFVRTRTLDPGKNRHA
jgi:hypothetical protein